MAKSDKSSDKTAKKKGEKTHKKGKAPQNFICPFPDCNRIYTRSYDLKMHLIGAKSQGGDEKHFINDRQWGEIDLRLNRRSRNLTQEEKNVRYSQFPVVNHRLVIGSVHKNGAKATWTESKKAKL